MAWREVLRQVARLAGTTGLYAVGGFVRDRLLGRAAGELDLVVEGDALALAKRLAEQLGGKAHLNPAFGTARLVLPTCQLDIATARAEVYPGPGLAPVVHPAGLSTDLFRRDFTINAMALPVTEAGFGPLVDPYGGQTDLKRGWLRMLHRQSFIDDPSRLLRGLRFATRLAFRFEPETEQLAQQALAGGRLSTLLPERRAAELRALLAEPQALQILQVWQRLGVWGQLFASEAVTLDLELLSRLADAAPPFAAAAPQVRGLCLAVAGGEALLAAYGWPCREHEQARWVLRRLPALQTELPQAKRPSEVVELLADWPNLGLAVLWLQVGPEERRKIERYVDEWARCTAQLTGADLLRLGASPGPALGRTLKALRAARLDGRVTSREDEERLALALLEVGGETDAF